MVRRTNKSADALEFNSISSRRSDCDSHTIISSPAVIRTKPSAICFKMYLVIIFIAG